MTTPAEKRRLTPCPDCAHLCSVEALQCPNCGKPFNSQAEGVPKRIDDGILTHVLNQSSLKVGMCLTLLGLIRVVEGVKNISSVSDELLAIAAVGFLLSSLLSYFALKESDATRKHMKGKAGDLVFSASLCLLAVVCGIVAFEML